MGLFNLVFFLLLPAYLGAWMMNSSCHTSTGLCGLVSKIPQNVYEPATILNGYISEYFPILAFVIGAPAGLVLAALFKAATRNPKAGLF